MASRKDHKGRVLRKGESQRKNTLEYVYSYRDAYGNRKQITSKDLLKLRKREESLIRDQMDGLDAYTAGTSTVNFMYDRYIKTKTELRSTTASNYKYMYDKYVRDTFGKKIINTVKFSDIVFYYISLMQDKNLQINTLETIHTLLRPAFQMAVRDHIIRVNPTEGAMAEVKKKFGKQTGVRHALTIDQQRSFIEYVREHPVYGRWATLFTVLLGTGCRIGEVIGLRWSDVDMEDRVININHSVTYYPRREETTVCEFQVSLPKTEAGIREIPMIDAVKQAFEDEYEYQLETGFNEVELDGMQGFIFMNREGNLYNPQCINRAIKRIVVAHNSEEEVKAVREHREPVMIPNFSCHHLRHTFCSRLCENETNIKVIQSVMGHKDVQTTMNIYAEVSRDKKADALRNLAETIDVF